MVLLPHSAFIGLEGLYIIESVDCSQSPIFPLDHRCRSLSPTGRHLGLLMWAKLGRNKMPVGRGDGVKSVE